MRWEAAIKLWDRIGALACIGWMLVAGGGFARAANQSISLTPGTTLSFSVPAQAAFTNLSSTRLEMRLHDWSVPSGIGIIFNNAGFQVRLRPTGELCGQITGDPAPAAGGEMCANINGRSDVTMRLQRDAAAKLLRFDVWSTTGDATIVTYCGNQLNGTAGNKFPCPIQTINLRNWSGPAWIGDENGFQNTRIRIAWMKWYSTLASDNHVPTELTSADLADWRFESNRNDTGPFHIQLGSGGSFLATPIYPPSCTAGIQESVRAGLPAHLDGSSSYPLDGGTTLQYLWQQLGGPSTAALNSRSTAQPNIQGLIFGNYVFQLTVTDQTGQSASCTVKKGSVATDSNGVVVLANPLINKLLGDLVGEGYSPWPWFDDRNRVAANAQIANLSAYYVPWWRNFQPGTITLTAGSAIVVGQGTALRALCNGGTSPRGGAQITWQYTGTDNRTHYAARNITACVDDTHVTMAVPYPTSLWGAIPNCADGCSGLSYTFQWDGDTGGSVWGFGSAPANYYDNVAAFYSLYYRTGIDDYLTAARLLADEWWEHPAIDQGTGCNFLTSNYDSCWQPRQIALLGLVVRALDGRPDMWPGLRIIWERYRYYINNYFRTNGVIDDVREDAYILAMVAECALADPDATQQQMCRTTLSESTGPVWSRYQRPNRGWEQFYTGAVTSIGGSGTVTVTTNSTTVIGSGTNWNAGQFGGGYFWIFEPPASIMPATNSRGDSTYYRVTFVNPTTLTLDRPYEGRSGSGKGYVLGGNFVGWGAQPFMEGLLATAFDMAASALDGHDNAARDLFYRYNADAVFWIRNYGMNRDSAGGLYTGAQFPGCQAPIPNTDRMCYPAGDSASQHRSLSAEVMRALGAAYKHSPSINLKADADTLMSQMYSKPGTAGLNPDGEYLTDWNDVTGTYLAGIPPLGTAPKWFGQFFGFPNTGDWAAKRAGGPLPPAMRPLQVSFDLTQIAGAQRVLVSVTGPDGLVTQTSCDTSPCTIQVDTRLGNPLVALQYLSSDNILLASGQPLVAPVL